MTEARTWTAPIKVFFFLILMQAAHSIEEIAARLYEWMPRVTGGLHETFGLVPQVSMTRAAFIVTNILVVLLMLAVGFALPNRRRWVWRIAFAIGIIEIINGSAHLFEAIMSGGYFPGALSAVGLVAVGTLFCRSYLRRSRNPV